MCGKLHGPELYATRCRCDPRSLPEKRSARKVRLHTSLDAMTSAALAAAKAPAGAAPAAAQPGPSAADCGPVAGEPSVTITASDVAGASAHDAQPGARELAGLA